MNNNYNRTNRSKFHFRNNINNNNNYQHVNRPSRLNYNSNINRSQNHFNNNLPYIHRTNVMKNKNRLTFSQNFYNNNNNMNYVNNHLNNNNNNNRIINLNNNNRYNNYNNNYNNNNNNYNNNTNINNSNNNNNRFKVVKTKKTVLLPSKENTSPKNTITSNNNDNTNNDTNNNNNNNTNNNVIHLKIPVHTRFEYEKIQRLYAIYKSAMANYKNSIETFNKSIEKLIKKLNFKNLLLRLMRDNLFTRLPSHSLLENIKNIAECSIQYYELTLKINESIKNSNVSNFKFDENKPIDSFNRGIDLFNKVTNVMIKGLEKLKEIIENVVKFQRLIIEDDTFPLPIENKMIVLDKMKKIKFYEVKNYKDIIDEKECVICFNEFKNNEYVKIFGCGKHIFHEDCIKEWLQQDFRCPLCKYSIKKDLLNDLY